VIPKCCCAPCTDIAADTFTRANETPVASPWVKLSGTDWNLASNVLDAVAAADYKHTTAFPGASGDSRTAVVDFKLSTDGSVEVQTGKTDASNYFAAKLTYASGSCAILTAFAYVAGVGGSCTPGTTVTNCVQVWGLTTGVWYRLRVCLIPNTGSYGYETQDKVIALIEFPNDATRIPISCQTLVEGPTVGTLSGIKSTMAAQFDNFKASYYRDSPSGSNRTCPWCHTSCSISQDAFTTDEPCLWDVISGSYSVSGGLMTLGTSPSKIQHHIFHPGLKTTHKVTVDVQDNAVESKVFIGNGYAKLTYSGGLRTLRLYDNSDTLLDTDAQTVSVTSDSALYMALSLCYSRGVLSCTVTGRGSSLCADAAIAETASGYWVSLGGNSGAVFDNFVFSKTYDATAPADLDCATCAACPGDPCGLCLDGTMCEFLLFEIPEMADSSCTDCDTIPAYVLQAEGEDGTGGCIWQDFPTPPCSIPGGIGSGVARAVLRLVGSDYILTATLQYADVAGTATSVSWQANLGTAVPDCTAWDRIPMAFYQYANAPSPNPIQCDATGTTAYASTLCG